ncbi:MAG: hypothetical protein JXA93_11325 [Anaerolineae bacterium]|nr:hypothetical protein [Anaerolineae bacterium]
MVAQMMVKEDAGAVIRDLDRLVTRGPGDLEIIEAMTPFGYDMAKWAEGQSVLAELVASEQPSETLVARARRWHHEAADAASHALTAHPTLLVKLGMRSP